MVCVLLVSTIAACGGEGDDANPPDNGGGNANDVEPMPLTGITRFHNQVRASVLPAANPALPAVQWSPTIALVAQETANRCRFEHTDNAYGENLFASAGSLRSADAVVEDWASEVANYRYDNNTCNGVCGHYTQVVWRQTTHLGCGYARCTVNSPFQNFPTWDLWVCNYNPSGNWVGQRPY